MRISDWSSDVCSSDLRAHHAAGRHARPRRFPDIREGEGRRPGIGAGRMPDAPAQSCFGCGAHYREGPDPLPTHCASCAASILTAWKSKGQEATPAARQRSQLVITQTTRHSIRRVYSRDRVCTYMSTELVAGY